MKEVLFQYNEELYNSHSTYYTDGTFVVENDIGVDKLITNGFFKLIDGQFHWRHNVGDVWRIAAIGPDLGKKEFEGLVLAYEIHNTLLK